MKTWSKVARTTRFTWVRRLFTTAIAGALLAAASPAVALPGVGEFYVGGGGRSFGGIPSLTAAYDALHYGYTFEVGVDDLSLLRQWGVGFRADWPASYAQKNLEIRYMLVNLATIRTVAAASIGLGDDYKPDVRFGGIVTFRTVLGLPYVATSFGLFRDPNQNTLSSAMYLVGGLAF